MTNYSIRAIVRDTDLEGRLQIIRAHCRKGTPVELRREPSNPHNPYAIAVWVHYRTFFGLLEMHRQIGYIRTAWGKTFAQKLDSGRIEIQEAYIRRVHAPEGAASPHVSIVIECRQVPAAQPQGGPVPRPRAIA